MILPLKEVPALENPFPTDWQRVLFRNFGVVPTDRIAEVLGADEGIICQESRRLGLEQTMFNPEWISKGYITIIRDNWHIVSYAQLLTLLDWTEEKLDFALREDDFLGTKLGGFKPAVLEPRYRPLTEFEKAKTEEIARVVREHDFREQPFDFYKFPISLREENAEYDDGIADRVIYSYSTVYGDTLAENPDSTFPEILLERLEKLGINGIWMQGVLSQLVPSPFEKTNPERNELRLRNLRHLIEKCRRYGIRIWLYLNEPRAWPEQSFRGREDWMGERNEGFASLCSSDERTARYLSEAIRNLALAAPDLGGIMTITMSENQTHCRSHTQTSCNQCQNRSPEELAAGVNNIIFEALASVGSRIRLVANLWGWSPLMGWSGEQIERGIRLLHRDIEVMCVSEHAMKICKGGVENVVFDYSISNVGPSEQTEKDLRLAKELGHKVWAKIQCNNSWEMSAAPYLPVFDLVFRHLGNLKKLGISGLFLSWTLGGIPL